MSDPTRVVYVEFRDEAVGEAFFSALCEWLAQEDSWQDASGETVTGPRYWRYEDASPSSAPWAGTLSIPVEWVKGMDWLAEKNRLWMELARGVVGLLADDQTAAGRIAIAAVANLDLIEDCKP